MTSIHYNGKISHYMSEGPNAYYTNEQRDFPILVVLRRNTPRIKNGNAGSSVCKIREDAAEPAESNVDLLRRIQSGAGGGQSE